MLSRSYCRCNSGHYFVGETCPIDGWSSPESKELTEAIKLVVERGLPLSLETLRQIGLSESTLKRAIVIEFGVEESAFEAIVPQGYMIDGKWKTMQEVGKNFL